MTHAPAAAVKSIKNAAEKMNSNQQVNDRETMDMIIDS